MNNRLIILLLLGFTSTVSAQNSSKQIIVIGGGMAGVSAAYYIHKIDSNALITIVEKQEKLGGNAQTIELKNSADKLIHIDVGPQYFTSGPWDDYIQFLKENKVYHSEETYSMVGSITLKSENNQHPILTTPINGDFRGEKLNKLLKFRKFNIEANKVYKHSEKWKGISIEKWVEGLNFKAEFKQTVIYPFLAASLGTNVESIKSTAAAEIVKLFAFRKPKQTDTFSIMQKGMGDIIDQLAQQFPKAINILNSSEVVRLINDSTIEIMQQGQLNRLQYDYIVFATHPYQASKILNDKYPIVSNELKSFPYFDAHIVVHTDSSFASQDFPSFLNITTTGNDVNYCTMNLSIISEDYKGIYKTWMPNNQLEKVKDNGTFIHDHTFKHPLITPDFIEKNERVRLFSHEIHNLSIIGAWSEGLETQNSAVLSGQRAAKEYNDWKIQLK